MSRCERPFLEQQWPKQNDKGPKERAKHTLETKMKCTAEGAHRALVVYLCVPNSDPELLMNHPVLLQAF